MNHHVSRLAAILLAVVAYAASRPSKLDDTELAALASRWSFERIPLPQPADPARLKTVRSVHPSLERISAWVSSVGAAATLADLDGDGLPNDLVHVDPRTDEVTVGPVPGLADSQRYKPFILDTTPWSQNGYSAATIAPMGTLVGDFNEDGLTDILLYFWGRTPLIYWRQAKSAAESTAPEPRGMELSNTSFTVTELSSTGERWYSDTATQGDFDGDGHVDVVIGNYFQDGARVLDAHAEGIQVMHQGKAKALNGGYKHFFLWKPADASEQRKLGGFEEVKNFLSDELVRGWTVAIGAADLDGDLLPELYIANDFGPDRLLHNRSKPGQLHFVSLEGHRDFTTPKSCVLGHDSFKGMGVDFGDLNGDGRLDIFVSNIATRFGLTESHFVWMSSGEIGSMLEGIAPYSNQSERLGLSRSGFGWDARFADFDNDGVLELVQACGFMKGQINRWPELQALGTSNNQIVHNPRFWPNFRPGADVSGKDANAFFVRSADGRYRNIANRLGLGDPMLSRGIALADVDGDGRVDFVCANQWGPSYFFKNTSSQKNAFLELRLLRGRGSPAIGAVASIQTADGRRPIAQIDGGSGHSGRRSHEIHFGLGTVDPAKPVSVDLRWRDTTGAIKHRQISLPPGRRTLNLDDVDRLALAPTAKPLR